MGAALPVQDAAEAVWRAARTQPRQRKVKQSGAPLRAELPHQRGERSATLNGGNVG
jgi:hypothetical protein